MGGNTWLSSLNWTRRRDRAAGQLTQRSCKVPFRFSFWGVRDTPPVTFLAFPASTIEGIPYPRLVSETPRWLRDLWKDLGQSEGGVSCLSCDQVLTIESWPWVGGMYAALWNFDRP